MSVPAVAGPPTRERPAPPIYFPWRLVTFQKGRTVVAAAAIGFAVLVMFMQLGFYGATVDTALATPGQIDGELFVVSSSFVHLSETGHFPRTRLTQALGAPGVTSATPLYTRFSMWRALEGEESCLVQVFAFPLTERPPLRLEGMASLVAPLTDVGTVSVDSLTQPACPKLKDSVKLDQQVARLAGKHTFGMGFLAASSVVTSDKTYGRLFPDQPLGRVNIGVLKIEPGRSAVDVQRALRVILPTDTEIVTADEMRALQVHHWVDNTAVGNIFGVGTAVGFLVGLVVVYQVLSTGVRNQLPQYAVLRAIGCADGKIYSAVLVQGWILTVLGFLPGCAIALGLYAGLERATLIQMPMTLPRFSGVLAMSLVLSTLSGLLCLRKLENADPAALF